jgi:hypothetical protein
VRAAAPPDTRKRIWGSNSSEIRLSPTIGGPLSAAFDAASVAPAKSRAVVATLAPAASFRNRRLLVRSFFTRNASYWIKSKITENFLGQKGTHWVSFYFDMISTAHDFARCDSCLCLISFDYA